MTVGTLTRQLSQEELVGWAAYFELKGEQEERAMQRAKTARGAQTMGSR